MLQKVRSILLNVFAHNYAENLRTQRAAERKAHGLPLTDVAQPWAVADSNNPTTIHTGGGVMKGAALAVLMLAIGAGATRLLTMPTPTRAGVPAAVEPAKPGAQAPVPPDSWDAVYEEQQPDGTWKEVKRDHLSGKK